MSVPQMPLPRIHRALIVLAVSVLAACGNATPDDQRPTVLCTTGMIADLARQIVGEAADVRALMGPGVDPHLFKPSEGDIRILQEADLILYNGLYLEGKMAGVLEKVGRSRPVVAVAESVPKDRLLAPDDGSDHPDPHLWMDVSLWSLTLDPMRDALEDLLPESKDAINTNTETVRNDLKALDQELTKKLQSIPKEQRVLVTAHDAFGYFGRRYDVEVLSLQGISTLAEASVQDVDSLVDTIVKRGIKSIFVESSIPKRSIEAVQGACASRGHEVSIGGELFTDAMGKGGTPEGTYVGMLRHNVDTIVGALK